MISEHDFQDLVYEWLIDHYQPENVYREPTLRTGRRPDFLVYTPLAIWAIEVENQSEDVTGGIGQAILYAGHQFEYTPAIVFPTDSRDREEIEILRTNMRVIELDPDTLRDEYT